MSQPDDTAPDSGGEPNANKPKGRDSKRPDRSQASNIFLYLMFAVVVAALVTMWMNWRSRGEEVKFGEFEAGLRSGRFSAKNVHEVVIGPSEIRFQDRPEPEPGQKVPESQPEAKRFYVPTHQMGDEKEAELTRLLSEQGIVNFEYEKAPPEWYSLIPLLVIPVIFLLFFVFLFRRMGGAGSAMSFGRSRGKLYAQEDIRITFKDAAGIEEAVEELREVVEFLRTPAKYQALGGRIPRGVLLVGPPGTGKTLLAKAVAGEAGVPFFSLSGSDFVEMFVGVGAARVRDMFQQAVQRSPAIIFIDELDALGKTRGSGMPGGHDEREQTLNALLVEMDGFSSDLSVIVMAATNRPETLDPALLRPGRFDRHVTVDRPDVKGREAILKVHAARIKMDETVNLSRLARISPGFVGADLANLVNEAALLAARKDKKRVTMKDFEEGIERVVAGLEKQTRLIHEDEKLRVSYHECGHALVACSLPHMDPVHKISIIPRGMGLGYTLHFPEDERHLTTRTELQNRICCLLGGIAAEAIVFEETSTGAQNDLQRASSIARRMVTEFGMSKKLGRVFYTENARSQYLGAPSGGPDVIHSEETIREIDLEVKRIIDEASEAAHEILGTRRACLDHMARELMECEVMDADHLKRILDQHKTSPQLSPGTRLPAAGDESHGEPIAVKPGAETAPARGVGDGA
ncbi:MAG: ATP-dependent zinc metalloprotease FtsH [Planctomycetes bacterium]|nr:ATP-dependent zinc metalloprotease FtsH [Planctomycetota bacterium]